MNEILDCMSFDEVLAELVGALVGALVGVFLGLEADRRRKRGEYRNRIHMIAPKIMEEFKVNLDIYEEWKSFRDRFWLIRYRLKKIRQEAYREDLWRWSIENNGEFPRIYETITDMNFYLDRYGNNPQFQEIQNKLLITMETLMLRQPAPFDYVAWSNSNN